MPILREMRARSFLHGYEWGLGYTTFFALIDVDIDKTDKRTLTKTTEVC